MPVPSLVAADLVVVEADLSLCLLETFLDRLPGPGDPDHVSIVVPAGPAHR